MMLGQLICLDRRYQRMNCFNIREAQALLKKRFFVDLINSNDHHTLLAKTMLGLRFKTYDLTAIQTNGRLVSNFGLSRLLSNRSFSATLNNHKNEASYINIISLQYILKYLHNSVIFENIMHFILNFVFTFQHSINDL